MNLQLVNHKQVQQSVELTGFHNWWRWLKFTTSNNNHLFTSSCSASAEIGWQSQLHQAKPTVTKKKDCGQREQRCWTIAAVDNGTIPPQQDDNQHKRSAIKRSPGDHQ
jgi:hypothetical protein